MEADAVEPAEADAAAGRRHRKPAGLVGDFGRLIGVAQEFRDGAEGAEIPLAAGIEKVIAQKAAHRVGCGHEAIFPLSRVRQGRRKGSPAWEPRRAWMPNTCASLSSSRTSAGQPSAMRRP